MRINVIYQYFMHKLSEVQNSHVFDYVVLGTGIGGMQALAILTKQTGNLFALEAQEECGGRILTVPITELPRAQQVSWIWDNPNVFSKVTIEKGATWIEHGHSFMLALCKQFELGVITQESSLPNLYLHSNTSDSEKQVNEKWGEQLKQFISKMDQLAQLYYSEVLNNPNPNQALLSKYDQQLVMDFLKEYIKNEKARELVENFLQHTQCISCEENSMHEVLMKHARSNDIGILKQYLKSYPKQDAYLIQGGTHRIIEKLKCRIDENLKAQEKSFSQIIKYRYEVVSVENTREDFATIVSVNHQNNEILKIRTKKVVCTIPLAISKNISFSKLSPAKRYIFDNQIRTSSIKAFIIVKRVFWDNFSGDGMFSYEYPVNMCHDVSPQDESCGIMVFFINGKKYQQWNCMFKDQQNEAQAKKIYLIDLMCKLFRVDELKKEQYFSECLFYQCSFMSNPYIKSGFQSNTRPGTFENVMKMKESLDSYYVDQHNVVFIGSEYSKKYPSYMEGAVRVSRQKSFNLIGENDQFSF